MKRRLAITKAAMGKLRKICKASDIRLFTIAYISHFVIPRREVNSTLVGKKEDRCSGNVVLEKMLKISWTELCTNVSVLKELGVTQRLSTTVLKLSRKKYDFFTFN